MASHNAYVTYKRETAQLVYWIIQAFNSIIRKTGAKDEDGLSLLNTTGQTTVKGLVSMVCLPSALFMNQLILELPVRHED
jgi:hypothetical protein